MYRDWGNESWVWIQIHWLSINLELIFLESSSRVFTQADKILDLSKHRAWSHNSKISQLIRKIDRGDR